MLDAQSLHVFGSVSLRLLALEIGHDGLETYHVSFSLRPQAALRSGRMKHEGGQSWTVMEGEVLVCANVPCGSPDEVFVLALGQSSVGQQALEATVQAEAPHWPPVLKQRLARRRLAGAGTIVFDVDWFLLQLATAAMDRPLLFPNATSKLGLGDLERASALLRRFASLRGTGEGEEDAGLPHALLTALATNATKVGAFDWDGEGRLIGEYSNGELAQLGADIGEGCRAALGSGPLQVVFDPGEPLGVGLGPLQFADASDDMGDEPDTVGWGAEVGEVDADGAAERAGVKPGMALSRLSKPHMLLSSQGPSRMTFEDVLDEIDARREAGLALHVTFETAASATHLYAVEMPAAAALEAFAAAVDSEPPTTMIDAGLGTSLQACTPLWREDTPRLFLGEPGSLTAAHTDICPQLEVAHGLLGCKMLGVASHEATPRLEAEHGEDEAEEATRVPTERPLTQRQLHLLTDADVTLALLMEGDLAVFDSGALHFASNGQGGWSGAVYHGMITVAAVPRLRLAAAKAGAGSSVATDGYHEHLFAADLLRIVEPRLKKSGQP